ncbi:MAG: ribonuclease HII [Porticoccaceae bacterium]|nr:ribonuclease HII [Porticoccaceae bacterium]
MLLAGVDEVGRGPLAGDVVVAAVILDQRRPVDGLADSKKLSASRREKIFPEIISSASCYSLGRASVAEIDELNILQATLLAMSRAVDGLSIKPEFVVVDGNRCPDWVWPSQAIVKGDTKVPAISAASIVAKVSRDKEMQVLDQVYPGYGFAAHKGYGTRQHLMALKHLGPCPEHRRSFRPVAELFTLAERVSVE